MAGTNKNYPKKTNIDQALDYGKIPPQAMDLEEAVLGAIMLEKDAIIAVMDIIQPESFYKDGHQKIFKAVLDLSQELQPIDILTVNALIQLCWVNGFYIFWGRLLSRSMR